MSNRKIIKVQTQVNMWRKASWLCILLIAENTQFVWAEEMRTRTSRKIAVKKTFVYFLCFSSKMSTFALTYIKVKLYLFVYSSIFLTTLHKIFRCSIIIKSYLIKCTNDRFCCFFFYSKEFQKEKENVLMKLHWSVKIR